MNDESDAPARPPRLLDQVNDAVRRKHYSRRTEEAHVHWIKRFIFFSDKRNSRDAAGAWRARWTGSNSRGARMTKLDRVSDRILSLRGVPGRLQ